jgi:hypothetical protein
VNPQKRFCWQEFVATAVAWPVFLLGLVVLAAVVVLVVLICVPLILFQALRVRIFGASPPPKRPPERRGTSFVRPAT